MWRSGPTERAPLDFFTQSIRENALYLLDEPENSLSAAMQLKLKGFLEDSARFFGCQLVLATHLSPFLLSMEGGEDLRPGPDAAPPPSLDGAGERAGLA